MLPDHYEALGTTPDADIATLREAYLRRMRAYHPDRRPGDPAAEDAARRANAAWHVLSDRARRAAYDRLRETRASGAGGNGGTGHVRVVAPTAARARPSAYSAEGERFRAAFTRACMKVGAGVFAVGMLFLLVAAAW